MNSSLPAMVADKYKNSNIVVFSTGCVYPILTVSDLLDENLKPDPIGNYSMSCLARERAFQHAADKNGTKVFIYRLSYAIDLRYGVLYDLAHKILNETPISLSIPYLKYVWQGYANEVAIREDQMKEIDRAWEMYPRLNDDEFVKEFLKHYGEN